jgi:UDP-2,3-diacylglucosamine hydrolase
VPAYFASDVHLRLDRPERSRRFARWVNNLDPHDTLTIVGDLCDFWFASRQASDGALECPGLRALVFFRERGGSLTILPGNHDAWLGPYYERNVGVTFAQEPLRLEICGLRLLLVHGHLLGGRKPWKGAMESRAFLRAFRRSPASVALALDRLLERSNERRREADDLRHLAAFRRFATRCAGTTDLVVIGHIHRTVDDVSAKPRLVVLGGWHTQSSYLRVDASGASLIVEPDNASIPC